MDSSSRRPSVHDARSSYQSATFDRDVEIRVHDTVGSASVSPSGRDVVLASKEGLHIVDLDSPYSTPRLLSHRQQSPPADVQWSPFAARDSWIVSTANQKALVWNLDLFSSSSPIQFTLHAHSRAITDINFSAHHPDILATCSVDSFVHCWDLRQATKPVMTFADWRAGATQVKWNRQDEHILASSHDKYLKIWDERKGAYPLKTIEAHTTKIYGIDWNRTRSTGILTCSLDRSIKFWDYAKGDDKGGDKPERVIRTQFPVWRARHTPFGWGVLALPQRGDNDLHLYDRRLSEGVPRVGFVDPVHSFSAHTSNVKEFLWRSRGNVENGIDERDFQLVSWGMDQGLHLHRIDPKILKAVGHEKGKDVRKNMPTTRQGATYKTFNTPQPTPQTEEAMAEEAEKSKGLLGRLVTAAGMSKMPLPVTLQGRDQGSMTYSGKLRKRTADPIKWMSGVTMRSRSDTISRGTLGFDNPESLKDEITTVSQKYTKVDFEVADVHGRTARVTLNGPWGPEEKPAFLRVNFEFPGDYPFASPAICTLERTAAGISEENMESMNEDLKSIIDHYQSRKMGCLEAVITYLLGERGLEESITLPAFDGAYDLLSPEDESSSEDDDDDAIDGPGQDLETSAEGVLGVGSAQTNVPVAKECGAYWSADGRLICFFPPKPEPKPLFSLDTLRTGGGDRANKSHRHFEGFGRLAEESPSSKRRPASEDEEHDDDSAESWTSSSSSSSDDSYEDISRLPSRFHPPTAWRAATLRTHKTSSYSGSGGTAAKRDAAAAPKPKSVITIHNLSDILPAKYELGLEYEIFGNGPEVCAKNAEVAAKYGYHDLAAVWDIAKHILYNEVPLEIMDQKERKEPILVAAKRMMVRMRKKESGLDLGFDEPASVANPTLTGRVKWGKHPFGSAVLIPEFLEYYEKLADIQMLAMLSCVFAEPAAREGISNALQGLRQEELPIQMKAPAFSLDYFPSKEVAWSLYQESKNVNVQAATPGSAGPWDYFDTRVGTYGSAGSSNGPWERDLVPNGPQTPYSTGNTPPVFPSHSRSSRNSMVTSLSSSPEQGANRNARRSNSNLTAAFSLSKAFNLGTSPSSQDRFRSEADLSTSAPTSGITWGSTTFYSGSSSISPQKKRRNSSRRSSFKTFDSAYSTESSGDDYTTDDSYVDAKAYIPAKEKNPSIPSIKVTLKNQNQFDQEGHASVPLLPPEHAGKYASYREIYADQLSAWDLPIKRAEMLKFNGFINYWPNDMPVSNNGSAAGDIVKNDGSGSEGVLSKESSGYTLIAPPDEYPRSPGPLSPAPLTLNDTGFGANTESVFEKEVKPKKNSTVTHDGFFVGSKNCAICWERIAGLAVKCPTGMHMAHLKCYEDYVDGRSAKEMEGRGVSCGCKEYEEDM